MGKYIPYDKRVLEEIARGEKERNNTIVTVLTGGCFDIFQPHPVHILFLRECKKKGYEYRDSLLRKIREVDSEKDEPESVKLFVNVVNDDRETMYKKEGPVPRPFFAERVRAINVSSIDVVDYCTIHPYVGNPNKEEDIGPTERLAGIVKPDVIIKGKGWRRGEKQKLRKYLKYKVRLEDIDIDEEMNSTEIFGYVGRVLRKMGEGNEKLVTNPSKN